MDPKQRFNQMYKVNPNSFGGQPMQVVKNAVKNVNGGKALVIGVGTGRNLPALIEKGFDITAIDISEESIKILQDRFKDVDNLKLSVADIFSFDDNGFDYISAIGVLHFLPREKGVEMIKKMQEITVIGGINVIVTKMVQNIFGDLPHIFEHDELKGYYANSDWDIKVYNEKEMPRGHVAIIIVKKMK